MESCNTYTSGPDGFDPSSGHPTVSNNTGRSTRIPLYVTNLTPDIDLADLMAGIDLKDLTARQRASYDYLLKQPRFAGDLESAKHHWISYYDLLEYKNPGSGAHTSLSALHNDVTAQTDMSQVMQAVEEIRKAVNDSW